MDISILFIGDIIGRPGLEMVQTWLPILKNKYKPDVVTANGENISDGKGVTEVEAKVLFELGVDVITGGNHTWDKHQSQEYMKVEPRVLRPQNYPLGTYGKGNYLLETKKGKVGVLNLQGRTFMSPIDCPFRCAEAFIKKFKNDTNVILIDFHAEATAEKNALLHFLDGKVSAIVGTHTHVQTSDERISENGTAYITDVGMTGPYDSVIGMKVEAGVNRFLYQTPQKYQTAESNVHLCALFLKIDSGTGKSKEIERILLPDFVKKI
ncbi:MAG: TIGR00282 family metallophosphoesterase [Ignavibacteriales bacterium]|nr:TIGR00282 family metallophosphoesterase [Ignavibacteriales bacterium]